MKILVLGRPGGVDDADRAGAADAAVLPSDTSATVAVSADGDGWILLNAPPHIGMHLRRHRALRDARPVAVVLTDAQLDHVCGLLSLRHGPPLSLCATPAVFEELTSALPLLQVLENYCGSRWHLIAVAGDCEVAEFSVDAAPGLRFTALSVAGGAPSYSPRRAREPLVGDRIALQIEDRREGHRVFYCSRIALAGHHALHRAHSADCLLVGATTTQKATSVVAGAYSMLEETAALMQRTHARRKVLIDVDRSDPALRANGAARQLLHDCGIETAYDGMEIEL